MQQLQVASVNIQYTLLGYTKMCWLKWTFFTPSKGWDFWHEANLKQRHKCRSCSVPPKGASRKASCRSHQWEEFTIHHWDVAWLGVGWSGLGGQNAVYGPPVLNRAEMQFTQVRNAGLQSRIHPQQGKIIWQQPAMCWDRTGFLMKLLGSPLMGRFKPTKHVKTRHQNGGIL